MPTAKVISGRIAIYPKIKVTTCYKRPQGDERSRSVRLQLDTAHIQRSTETRQVSAVMGRTWFLTLSTLRARQPPTHLVQLRLGKDSLSSELTGPCPYICAYFS